MGSSGKSPATQSYSAPGFDAWYNSNKAGSNAGPAPREGGSSEYDSQGAQQSSTAGDLPNKAAKEIAGKFVTGQFFDAIGLDIAASREQRKGPQGTPTISPSKSKRTISTGEEDGPDTDLGGWDTGTAT